MATGTHLSRQWPQPAIPLIGSVLCAIAGPVTMPHPALAGGTTPFTYEGITLTPYLGVFGGYSTNPDEVTGGDSSPSTEFDAGLKAAMEAGSSKFTAEVNGTLLRYPDVAKDLRWLYELKASGETRFSAADLLEYDVRRRRDNLDNRYDTLSHRARVFWTHTARDFEIKLGASYRNKDFLAPLSHNEYDYRMPSAEITLRAVPQAVFSPYLMFRGANIDYLNQIESIIDRDARDYSISGGVRWRPDKTFEASLGARYNVRNLDDLDYRHVAGGFVDVAVQWKPSDAFKVQAAVWRDLDEPYEATGLAADQKNVELSLNFKPVDRILLEGRGDFRWQHEIGTNVNATDFELNAAAYYEVSDSLRTFIKGRQLWEADRNIVDHTIKRSTTTEISVGVETNF